MSHEIRRHPLPAHSSGQARELLSLHFGARQSGRKAYIQAALHADEIPPMLVAQALREQLAALHETGKIAGEIVLVPSANPIGLGQFIQGTHFGRFDLATGVNFNRGYLHLVPQLKETLAGKLGADAQENTRLVRAAVAALLARAEASTETGALKVLLQTLAHDADIVLDLHCDNEAAMHVYCGTHKVDEAMALVRCLGAQALLTAHESGDDPFDETCGRLWPELAAHFGPAHPFASSCLSVTVELRGEADVEHALARADAQAILDFLVHAGHIDGPASPLPAAPCAPTPLAGVQRLDAPHAGVVVFAAAVGAHMKKGDLVADIIDPQSGMRTALHAEVEGVLFARIARRYAHAGMNVAKIAGATPFRSGKLLSM